MQDGIDGFIALVAVLWATIACVAAAGMVAWLMGEFWRWLREAPAPKNHADWWLRH